MRRERSSWTKWALLLLSGAIVAVLGRGTYILLTGKTQAAGLVITTGTLVPHIVAQSDLTTGSTTLLNGRVPSLSWIIGHDCHNGIQAYLQSVASNPDAALVGTGWLDPTTGLLINGESNNCQPGTLSMDSVIQLVHQHGGKAYLTLAMATDGTPGSWTKAQETAYIVKATQTPGYLDPIVREMQRANYDGVIMDLETVNYAYPNIQQIFATYNQQLWHLLQPLQKPYGIALIHKTSNHDEYYGLNGFEDWHLLAQNADFLVVMAVDQSYWTPGPSVSVPWLQQLLNYALKTMPQMLPHIIWELPLYGNTWHQANGQWVFEDSIDYQSAMQSVDQVGRAQIDQANSNLHDPYQPHLVYTDAANVTHALWFMNGQSLRNIIHDFEQILRKQPQFGQANFQFAVWWRTTNEPPDFWQRVDQLY